MVLTGFKEYLELLENSEYGVIDFEVMEPFNMVIKRYWISVVIWDIMCQYSYIIGSKTGGCIPGID